MKEVECLICGKRVANNISYVGSHVKRIHKIDSFEYIKKYYLNISKNFKIEKCGFCDKDAIPNFEIDHLNKTYILNYNKGFFCRTEECKNNISLKIFGEPYNKKKYEHIGSNSIYLSLLHKKNIKEINYKKSKGLREMNWSTSLENYIKKYGELKGTKKYKERNKKIGRANTLSYYKEKYGEEEGIKKYEIFRKKIHKALGPSKSKSSRRINDIFNRNQIEYVEEYKYENLKGKNGSIDFYLKNYNIVIEYYGDWWHCNPNYYKGDYFHRILKKFAYEIWEKDRERMNYIFKNEFKKNITILIVWEDTKFTDEYLINLLSNIKNKNTIFEI